MRVAIYGDSHITRKMNQLQPEWDNSVINIFQSLYHQFSSDDIELAIGLGDFFDKSVLEAKSVHLVTKVLDIINNQTFPTFMLLGNHEIDNQENNILQYLSEYKNIIPVTDYLCVDDKLYFIPYSCSIEDCPENLLGKYVFTHHDIYGSELAGGRVKASFGVDPKHLQGALKVFNGHVHLSSKFGNIINVGSITKMQQGELRFGETPNYYYLDTSTGIVDTFSLDEYFLCYLTLPYESLNNMMRQYRDTVKFILKVTYTEESNLEDILIYRANPRVLSLSLHKEIPKKLADTKLDTHRVTLDVKEFLSNYIKQDTTLDESDKPYILNIGLSLLEV